MTRSSTTADVAVIGAGVAGLAAARALVEIQPLKVIVVDMEPSYGCGSTGRAAGSIHRQLHTESLTRIAQASTADLRTFGKRYGVDIECESPGYLSIASRPASRDKLLLEDDIHRRVGLRTEVLPPDEIRARWDFLAVDDVLAGTFSPDDLNVDPYSVATALFKGARKGGASFMFGTKVTGFIRSGGGALEGMRTSGGEIRAPVVINAAGPWAAELCEIAGMATRPPIVPRRRHIWQVGGEVQLPREIPFMVDVDAPFYIRPCRELFLLSLMDEGEIPLLGNEPPFDWATIFMIEGRVAGRIPSIASASVAKGWAGWRTLTPDDCPVLGRVEEIPGLYMAAGFGGHGIALAPASGKLLASAILGEASSDAALADLGIARLMT